MTSLVAPKPSDGPTSPGLMSYGSDPAALDDYLNLDLFGTRAAHSPASSHAGLPVTPNTTDNTNPSDESMFDGFNPLDKMGAFDMGLLGSDLGMEQYSSLFQDMFPSYSETAGPSAPVIDPQLFTAPLAPPMPAPPPPAPIAIETDDDEDEELDEVAPLPATRSRKPKKNAAAAGGIAKRPSRASTPASVVPAYVHFDDPKPVIPPALGKGGVASYLSGERIGSQEPDEWRPTPEEYKKLSSKEKRQLRNKISARNFRVRRKEYITTLESHIADRDQLIAAIRSELSNTHNENTELRREIDALKRAIQEGRISAEATGLPPPRPLTPEQTASPATPSTPAPRRPTDIARANTQKDRSSDASGRSFWGGAVGHGGVTSVHTTLIPEVFPQQLSDKPRNVSPSTSGSSSASPSTPPNEGVNMNPLMNLSPLFGSSKLPNSPALNVGLDIMDQAFNQRTLEGFRAQLWGRMAKEAGARSVLAERRVETDATSPTITVTQPTTSPLSTGSTGSVQQSPLFSPQNSEPSSPLQSMDSSPQQSSASSASSPQQTLSSSPSLSMLNQPPATLRSLFEGAFSSLSNSPLPSAQSTASLPQTAAPAAQSTQQPATPAPALLQASSFGAGFLGSTSSHSGFAQSAASMQARAMLQAQWLALQQARQQNAGSSVQPASSSSMQPMSSSSSLPLSSQPSNAQTSQRELYLAHFAQAAAAQQQQQQLQAQQALGGLAAGVRPAYFASSKGEKEKELVNAMSSLSLAKDKKPSLSSALSASTEKKGTTPQQAAFAASLASQTLLQRMGSAFWDAFSTGSSRDVDTNKVRRVLEGKAVVKVVDVDADLSGLEERMKGVRLDGGVFGNLRGKK